MTKVLGTATAVTAVIVLILSGVSLLMGEGCANPQTQKQGPKAMSKEDSQKIAESFLRNSSTFRFDGIDSTLKLVSIEGNDKTYRWEFHYDFQCRHPGYGDRTGLILAQVITSHAAQIVVEQGEVVHAVLDGKWDMLTEKLIHR